MAYGTVNADVIGTSVANTSLGAGDASLMKNRLINSAMVIDQRNAGASVTPTDGQYSLDRWQCAASQSSKYTVQQNAGSVTPPVGFKNYLGATSSSAYTVNSTDYFAIIQKIEGLNTYDLGWGTANAKTVTLSFQVYSSLTGTFGGSIQNSAQNRSYPFSYSVPVANTWTTISITVAGDTTGTWLTTNGIGVSVVFSLGMATAYSGTAGAWAGAFYQSATGATSVVGTNGATFYITGVQLEVGSSATGFEYRQYQQELALCQRYYETGNVNCVGILLNTTLVSGNVNYIVAKRASTTATYSSASLYYNGTVPSISSSSASGATAYGFSPQITLSSGLTTATGGAQSGSFTASAEL
jgi:hypothetical protein